MLADRAVSESRPEQTIVCVLGMHRSGTSCLAGTFEAAGVFFGDVFVKNEHNPKGNRENPKIMALHESLLAANGGAWDSPPRRVEWLEEHERTRDEIVADFAGVSLWGFKDPRTLLTLDRWLDVLPSVRLAGTFRHPRAVASSLRARDGMSFERAVELWTYYNERLLSYRERFAFPIVSFDAREEEFVSKLEEMLDRLELSGDGAAGAFFDPALRHGEPSLGPHDLPGGAAELYERLMSVAL